MNMGLNTQSMNLWKSMNKGDIKMKKKENYPFWFYFDDEEDDYDEDGYYCKKDKTSIDYEVEEDERDNDFQFPIW